SRSRTILENTRWEVEEPISTPTLRMQISSSPSRLRPVLEKKIRPPCSSVSIFTRQLLSADLVRWALRARARPHPTTGGAMPTLSDHAVLPRGQNRRRYSGLHIGRARRFCPPYGAAPSNTFRQFALEVLVVELRLHAVDHALACEDLPVLPGNERVLHPVGDGRPAFGDVHGGVVGMDLARRPGLAGRGVRAEPGGGRAGVT